MPIRIVPPWLVIFFALFGAVGAKAHELSTILERGEVVVGIKADYEPFGYRDTAGNLVGLEADIAQQIAEILDVDLRLEVVTSADRLQKLAAGDVDVLVATLGDTQDRRRLVRMIEPGYYGGGASVLLPPNSTIRDWSDLKGRALCAVQGALWNRLAATRMLAEIRAFGSVRDAELALREGTCAGWLYDEAAIEHRLQDTDWAGYWMLPPEFVSPWAIAVAKNGQLATLLDQAVAEWLRIGWISELEEKWGLSPSAYVRQAEERWRRRDAEGEYVCQFDDAGTWPIECRELNLIEARDVQGAGSLILTLRDRFGLDLTPFYDPFSRSSFLNALLITVLLAGGAVLGSIISGTAGALMLQSRLAIVRYPVAFVLTLFRMTPPLLQLYLVFFGIGSLLAVRGITLDAVAIGILVLSLYAGSANAVALSEAADAVQTVSNDRLRRIARIAYPAVLGNCINIVKATAMVSAIAVGELLYASTSIIADFGNGAVMMSIVLLCYVGLVILVVYLFSFVEKWALRP